MAASVIWKVVRSFSSRFAQSSQTRLGIRREGNGALFGAVGILGGAGMNAGYVTFPPLPPCLDLAVVIGIQLPPARLMQMIQKIGDVHVFVNLLKSRSMVYS